MIWGTSSVEGCLETEIRPQTRRLFSVQCIWVSFLLPTLHNPRAACDAHGVSLGYLQIHSYVPKTTTGEEEKGILKCKTFTVAKKPHHQSTIAISSRKPVNTVSTCVGCRAYHVRRQLNNWGVWSRNQPSCCCGGGCCCCTRPTTWLGAKDLLLRSMVPGTVKFPLVVEIS